MTNWADARGVRRGRPSNPQAHYPSIVTGVLRGVGGRLEPARLATGAGAGLVTVLNWRPDLRSRGARLSMSLFENAGVDFIDEDGGGSGVRRRKRSKEKSQK